MASKMGNGSQPFAVATLPIGRHLLGCIGKEAVGDFPHKNGFVCFEGFVIIYDLLFCYNGKSLSRPYLSRGGAWPRQGSS